MLEYTSDNNIVISALNLTKRFSEFTAVNNISFSVHRGECYGLLGPNGAGKTSIARMIFGFSPITKGTLSVLSMDIRKDARLIKRRIGVVAQEDNLDPELTVLQNLLVYSSYFSIPSKEAYNKSQEILDFMGIAAKANSVVEELSGGMKRRLTIGRALINQPDLLILDEPTTGLDPYARHMVWQKLRKLKESGTTMLLTTHYLEEASQLCDRLLILNHGQIVEEGIPQNLICSHVGRFALEIGISSNYHKDILTLSAPFAKTHQMVGDDLVIYSDDRTALAKILPTQITAKLLPVVSQKLRETNLEDVFFKLTGENLAGEEESSHENSGGNW
jgi:lipooligosaccharide transport system ATP-binding protein